MPGLLEPVQHWSAALSAVHLSAQKVPGLSMSDEPDKTAESQIAAQYVEVISREAKVKADLEALSLLPLADSVAAIEARKQASKILNASRAALAESKARYNTLLFPEATSPKVSGNNIVPSPPASLAAAMPTPLTVIHNGLLRTNLRYDPIADEENVRLLLEGEADLQGIARFNEFSGELLLVRPVTSDPDLVGERGLPRPWTDADTATLQTFIQKQYIPKIGRDKIDAIVSMHARQRAAFHPIRDYLQSLTWDGVPRLDTWMREYWGATKQPAEYLAAVGAAWMISAVARIMELAVRLTMRSCLRAIRACANRRRCAFSRVTTILATRCRRTSATRTRATICAANGSLNCPTSRSSSATEIETVKAFIPASYEQYRPSYGRHEIRFPRQCVFARLHQR